MDHILTSIHIDNENDSCNVFNITFYMYVLFYLLNVYGT